MQSCVGRAITLAVAVLISLSFAPAPTAEDRGWWRVYFTSPPGFATAGAIDPELGLSRLLDGARASFHGAFYSISSKSLASKMIEAHRRGVEVLLVVERRNARGAEFDRLVGAGIPVVSETGRGLMHNKFAIIDGRIVWTGSYNLTENGVPKHNNNAIEIVSEELSKIFEAEFDEMAREL
jgi:phosphatidylserine/phosphatidylglycerophosphate/cardiolipin synthase-like enzyme